jgi:hypothetical protein
MFLDLVDHTIECGTYALMGILLSPPHQGAVAHDIGTQNSGESTLDALGFGLGGESRSFVYALDEKPPTCCFPFAIG